MVLELGLERKVQMFFNGQWDVGGWDLNLCGAIPRCVSIVDDLFKLSCYIRLPSEGDREWWGLLKFLQFLDFVKETNELTSMLVIEGKEEERVGLVSFCVAIQWLLSL